MANATTVEAFRVRKYLPPGTSVEDHDSFSCCSVSKEFECDHEIEIN